LTVELSADALRSPSGLTARADSRGRDWLVCAIAATVIFAQLIVFGANSNFLAGAFALVELAGGLVVMAVLRKEPRPALWDEIAPVGLVFAAALAWAAAPLVLSAPRLGLFPPLAPDNVRLELIKLAGVAATVLMGALIGASRTRLRLLVHWLALAGLAYVFLALQAGQASPLTVWGQAKGAHSYRFTGTFLNANAAGCAFGMIGLLALGLAQHRLGRTDPRDASLWDYLILALAVCAAAAAFGACALTGSRAALALSLACGVWMIATVRLAGPGRMLRIAMAAVLLLAGLAFGANQIVSRWGFLISDMALRAEGYRHYFALLWARPWFGYGLGGFKALKQSTLSSALAPAIWDQGAAHLALLQAALEGGAPFLALLCAAGALMLRAFVRARAERRRRGALAQAAAAAVILALACSFGDIALNVPAVAALAALLFGAVWANAVAAEHFRV
jgi:O-antigen ligase